MSYVSPNFKTKKKLKEAIKEDESVSVFNPGMFPLAQGKGVTTIEGPHYPEPHRWYARVEYDNDHKVVKVIS